MQYYAEVEVYHDTLILLDINYKGTFGKHVFHGKPFHFPSLHGKTTFGNYPIPMEKVQSAFYFCDFFHPAMDFRLRSSPVARESLIQGKNRRTVEGILEVKM